MAIAKRNNDSLPATQELAHNRVSWQLGPQRAAQLIYDMQQYFLNYCGGGEDIPLIKPVVENIAKLRNYCKQQSIPMF